MFRIDGYPQAACDGISRRALLEAAGAGLFGMSLPGLLAAEAQAAPAAPRAKAVIFVFLFGGPSQLETFDLKPEAPERIRGPFRPIAARTPGLRISEHLPRLAAISQRFCVVRTMTHPYNDHSGAAHYLQTGKAWHVPIGGGFNPTPKDWPALGAVVEYQAQQQPGGMGRDLPAYAVVPNSLGRLQEAGQYLRPGEHAGWLGRRYNPLTTAVDKKDLNDNPYWRPCSDAELTFAIEGLATGEGLRLDRTLRRVALLDQFDARRRHLDRVLRVREFDQFRRRALALVASEKTRRALDLRREPARIRDQYGRHLFGQSTLVARRLVEAGARFVTVHYDACDGYGWDSHVHSDDVKRHLLPTFDQGLAALLSDLHARGLLDETLVVALGEMGRTPQATPRWGRGHWSTLFPAVLAGAGIRGGTVFGTSDKDAAHVVDHPVSPESLAATIYHALGIAPDLRLTDPLGRPVPIVEGGQPVLELFG
jgi:hypothetical protein